RHTKYRTRNDAKMPKEVTVIVEMSSEKAYRLLFAEMSSWVKRKVSAAECTGKTGAKGAFEVSVDGHKVFFEVGEEGLSSNE
uniref:hypothetical protein n=1 Tax=Salmonella sp. s54412 TaxID=3160128 RepID=UPI003754A43C